MPILAVSGAGAGESADAARKTPVLFFFSPNCRACDEVTELVRKMEKKFDRSIRVFYKDYTHPETGNKTNVEYMRLLNYFKVKDTPSLAVVIGSKRILAGHDVIMEGLDKALGGMFKPDPSPESATETGSEPAPGDADIPPAVINRDDAPESAGGESEPGAEKVDANDDEAGKNGGEGDDAAKEALAKEDEKAKDDDAKDAKKEGAEDGDTPANGDAKEAEGGREEDAEGAELPPVPAPGEFLEDLEPPVAVPAEDAAKDKTDTNAADKKGDADADNKVDE